MTNFKCSRPCAKTLNLHLDLGLALAAVLFCASRQVTVVHATDTNIVGAAKSGERRAPSLAAASGFGRKWRDKDIRDAMKISVNDFRDAVYWSRVEKRPGIFNFSKHRELWPEALEKSQVRTSLTMNWGNPLYDDNATPHSVTAIEAFANYAAAAVKRFPAVDAIEVGNEFNGKNFVKGPVREMAPLDRARHSAAMLRASYKAVKAVRPDVRIIGAATHSLPLAYIWTVLEAGGDGAMNALAVHPYTTAPEHLAKQVNLLRLHPAARDLPLEITEFGAPEGSAPAHLAKMMCAMGLSGTSRAAWYPLRARKGDDLQPLLNANGEATAAGRAFAFAQKHMAGRAVRDIAPDAFTYACSFDEKTLVIWGAPRDVTLPTDARAFDPEGNPLSGPLRLSRETPMIVTSQTPIVMGETVKLAELDVVADSYDQFSYPPLAVWNGTTKLAELDKAPVAERQFDVFFRADGQRLDPITYPGQEQRSTPWIPYLSHPKFREARIMPDNLLPAGNGNTPVEIVHRFTARSDRTFILDANFIPSERSEDGISIVVEHDGKELSRMIVKRAEQLPPMTITMQTGQTLDIAVGPNGNRKGDGTAYRITLREVNTNP